jgi:branched-chain amino acid transport system ATP-binding protein
MLRLEGVHTYYGKSHVLQGLSMEVPRGTVVALLGRNGVGKTTTMRSIMGLTPPARGRILLNEAVINDLPPYRIAHLGVGYVPENRQVFPGLSVLENLRIGLDIKDWPESEKRKALDMIYESFPRLMERRNQLGATLSGGEQQMLAMARAVAVRPSLILLDEPSEGLMPTLVQEIERVIRWMAQDLKITVLLIEQDYRMSLRVSSHCYIMAKGSIVHSGRSADVADDRETLYASLGVA